MLYRFILTLTFVVGSAVALGGGAYIALGRVHTDSTLLLGMSGMSTPATTTAAHRVSAGQIYSQTDASGVVQTCMSSGSATTLPPFTVAPGP